MANFLITNLDAHICKRNESSLFKVIIKKILNLRIKLKMSVALFYIYGILGFLWYLKEEFEDYQNQ